MNMLPTKRAGRLPSAYLKAAWWVYRNPWPSVGAVGGAFALAALFGAALGGRGRRR